MKGVSRGRTCRSDSDPSRLGRSARPLRLGGLLILVALFVLITQDRTLGISLAFLMAGIWLFVMLLEVNESIR